jgi:hypothetical protein
MGCPTDIDIENNDVCSTPFFTTISTMSTHDRMTPFKEGDDADDADLDDGTHRRTERKRIREKQRRSDISNAFEELHQLTSQLEEQPLGTEEESSVPGEMKNVRGSSLPTRHEIAEQAVIQMTT